VGIISLMGKVMLAVAGFVIVLVLYFILAASIIRRRRELGILKAIGYTTFDLMNQISLSLMPPLFLGIIAGCVCGSPTVNLILSVALSAFGVAKADFIIHPIWIGTTGVLMLALSYAACMFISWRIRKISAYGLVTE